MSSEYVYTALIDVLSYRHRLERDIQNGQEKFKEDLEQSLKVFNSVNTAIFSVQAISDTIIITCNTHDKFIDFLNIIRSVFISFLERGLFIRGGIAYSKHFQSGRITYSHAVAKAYELESRESVYPRIVFDKNIIEMYQSSQSLPNIFDNELILHHNGVYYLNIIEDDNWDLIFKYASLIYENDRKDIVGNELAFLKHVWFEKHLFESKHAKTLSKKYIPLPEEV
ncbi:hypothetical protein [Thalassotalea mangrovi]|uniref:Guanylate cyclase domain-containing protein n=1 Tax=Thalassotalea mangrovi TaxID=2572245 RepID=A0A4U1B417_9GAMM|nr:hypothetical protein [Thalassotalea mangrovi]TKB44705.1 hypothetical protein E8M12_11265 [Thalassotalea mangrovi]